MEFDSLIYIIIAIVLAIINAVAQKKKKAQQNQAVKTHDSDDDAQFESVAETSPGEGERKFTARDPFDILFGDGEFVEEEDISSQNEARQELQIQDEPKTQLTDYQKKMQDTAQKLMVEETEARAEAEGHSYDLDENVIAASAIGDALTQEEEELAYKEGRSDFIKEFDAKKAIIYSEIIKPKYFSIGVNS